MAAEPSTYTTRDPAHPSNANQDHTTKDGEKPTNAFTAITDPDFLPTLESAPKTQHLKSYLVLISLVVGGVVGAWFYGFELFQFSSTQDPQIPFQPAEPTVSDSSVLEIISLLGLVVAALLVVISWTGALWIDWWELVLGYVRASSDPHLPMGPIEMACSSSLCDFSDLLTLQCAPTVVVKYACRWCGWLMLGFDARDGQWDG